MSHFNKIAFIFLSCLSSLGFAGSFSCTKDNLTIPCMSHGYELAFEIQYLKPNNDDIEFFRNTLVTSPYTHYGVEPKYRHAWGLAGRYWYDNGKDVALEWFHFNHTYSGQFTMNDPDFMSSADAKFDLDAVSVLIGQTFNLDTQTYFRLFYGAHYVNLSNQFKTLNGKDTDVSGHNFKSDFDGIGPMFGIDWTRGFASYPEFSVVARTAMALLIGDLSTQVSESQSLVSFTPALVENAAINQVQAATNWVPYLEKSTRRVVIPYTQLKLALRWAHAVTHGTVTVEGGWRYIGYFQSVHFARLNVGEDRPQQNMSNFTGQGPFIRFTFAG